MQDSVSTSMATACRSLGCKQTGIEKGQTCPKCGWVRPSADALDSESRSGEVPGASDPTQNGIRAPMDLRSFLRMEAEL